MTEQNANTGRDQAMPQAVQWNLGEARAFAGGTVWQCDEMRAGLLYARRMFPTQAEAEDFARRLQDVEPDHVFNVEAVKTSTVWN